MKIILSNLILLAWGFCSCKDTVEEKNIIITGKVKNIPATKVYLTRSHEWKNFLDSADYRNDTFSFRIKPKEGFFPFSANISFIDSCNGEIETFNYKNYILSTDSPRYFYRAFYIERGVMQITGVYNDDGKGITISAGPQTDALYKTQMMSFGYVDNENNKSREATIRRYKKLIKEHPSSYHFLSEILNNRELYSSEELEEYLHLFSDELQKSVLADYLREYIVRRPNFENGLTNFVLETQDGIKSPVMDTSANLNMLVFWASWCAPCRAEIPEIKKLYEEFKDKGLQLTSISIDENKTRWMAALENEKMPWKQFIVDSINIPEVQYRFDFSSIPFLVIVDKNGVPLLRAVGFDPNKPHEQRRRLIDSLLKTHQ